jgi:4-alpha-glucanotransferase
VGVGVAVIYHRCRISRGVGEAHASETELIVAPKHAYWPESLERLGGLAGVTAPLYGLRSMRNAGIGDFADLADFAVAIAAKGADFIGVNPVHALFPSQPLRISPYAPSSRRFSNVLLIALDQVPELEGSPKARALLESAEVKAVLDRLRAAELVDYAAVTALKLAVLEALFATFLDLPPSSPRASAFQAFRDAGGQALERQARFEALAEHLLHGDPASSEWRDWPEGFRSPEDPAVQAFAERHGERVTFYAYLQWLAASQLEQAQTRAVGAGMAIGLYLDLAVGVASDGAEAWSDQTALVDAVRIGAPPDDFNPGGQNWGLLPLSPAALKARAYRPFIDLLRQNMRHAGALRIDHVLGLARSFWMPADQDVAGAYIRYPLRDLLGLIALESQRQRCVVIGEDLGTVPASLRTELADHGLLGCRLLYFERDQEGACNQAALYPKACIASIGTHDLPTLAGFWAARDIDVREQLGLYAAPEQAGRDRQERRQTLKAFLRLLAEEDLLPEGMNADQPPSSLPWTLVHALHSFLSRTPAALKAVQLEDAVGALDQPNLPGTVDQYPNWRRKIGPPLERLDQAPALASLLELFKATSIDPRSPDADGSSPRAGEPARRSAA